MKLFIPARHQLWGKHDLVLDVRSIGHMQDRLVWVEVRGVPQVGDVPVGVETGVMVHVSYVRNQLISMRAARKAGIWRIRLVRLKRRMLAH